MSNKVTDKDNNEITIEAFHPGYFLREELESRNITEINFANKINITKGYLSKILNGKLDISIKIALKIEKALDISAEYWLNTQLVYDLQQARIKQSKQ